MFKLFRTKQLNTPTQGLFLMITITIFVLVSTEVISSIHINRLRKTTLQNYSDSIASTLSFWDNRLDVISNSLLQIANVRSGAYFYVCNAKDTLTTELSKSELYSQLNYYSTSQQQAFHFFAYFPSRNGLLIESKNYISQRTERESVKSDILSLLSQDRAASKSGWTLLLNEHQPFLLNYYLIDNNYIGAYIPLGSLFSDVTQADSLPMTIQLLDEQKQIICQSAPADSSTLRSTAAFDHSMNCVDYTFRIHLLNSLFLSETYSAIALTVIILIVGLFLLSVNLKYHVHHVLKPLDTLKSGMQEFSSGNTEIRLDSSETYNDREISSLYHVFNNMVEQITSLKIQVYESTLEKERIHNNFMITQIQPHFYSNILHLIFSLAQIRDFDSMQKLSYSAGSYFRYLLGEKGTFVKLSDEINCVRSYMEIQKLRYKEALQFDFVSSDGGSEDQIVIPMILQAFIGNSIKHNITLVPVLTVTLKIEQDAQNLLFSIHDNGLGFPPEILARINNNEDISVNGHHIGIQNIKERIKLFYDGDGSVQIESEPGNTLVKIRLPIIKKEDFVP